MNENIKFTLENFDFEIEKTNWCYFTESEILLHVIHQEKKTSISCNLVINDEISRDDFLNLNINYREPSYFVGRISGGKKDKQSEREILIGRSIDKIIRPLLSFLKDKTISLNLSVLNYSDLIDLSSIASIASIFCLKYFLNISCGALKVAIKDKDITLFPNLYKQMENDGIFTICSNKTQIFFLDAEIDNIPGKILEKYIKKAIKYCQIIQDNLKKIKSKNNLSDYNSPNHNINFISLEESEKLTQSEEIRQGVSAFLENKNIRIDKRELDEIRKISIENLVLNKTKAVNFFRGETVVRGNLNFCNDKFNIGESIRDEQNLIVSYNFPGFCVGNTSDKKSNRREMSHGDLIRAALQRNCKNMNLRLYADVLSSNGSSSMASVCALSAVGVQEGIFSKLCAGISIGCFRNGKSESLIVDMTALEDKYSEMDWKVAGTKAGITAIRVDCKSYISVSNLKKIFELSEKSISQIIEKMETLGVKNENPMEIIAIDPKKLGLFIGNSGQHIKELTTRFDCKIKANQDSTICVMGKNIDSIRSFIRSFAIDVKKKEDCSFIVKENTDGRKIKTFAGEIIINKKSDVKLGDILHCKVKNWELKEFLIQEIIINENPIIIEKFQNNDKQKSKKNYKR